MGQKGGKVKVSPGGERGAEGIKMHNRSMQVAQKTNADKWKMEKSKGTSWRNRKNSLSCERKQSRDCLMPRATFHISCFILRGYLTIYPERMKPSKGARNHSVLCRVFFFEKRFYGRVVSAGRRQAPAVILINQKLIYNLKGGRGKAYAAVCLQRQINRERLLRIWEREKV